ncbi:MAG: hypothetical protein HYT10_02570 [Candidatus Levybacteria bacterium]|nr:hypothetical protein [Candidatus Levybacteria bacterium]
MGKPREEIKEKTYYKDIYFLYEILHNLKDIDEVKLFIKDILTKTELRMVKRRWHVANLLMEGHDIRTVAEKSKTSTSTVIRIKEKLEEGYGGLFLAIERTKDTVRKEQKAYRNSKRTRGGSKFVKGWFQ